MKYFGVDFGSSTSSVAEYRDGRAELLPIDGGESNQWSDQTVVDTIVLIRHNADSLVGQQAADRYLEWVQRGTEWTRPRTFLFDFKRDLASPDLTDRLIGYRMATQFMFEQLMLLMGVDKRRTIVGLPVGDESSIGPLYQEWVFKEMANRGEFAIVHEPVGMAIGVLGNNPLGALIFDFGGGTLDISYFGKEGPKSDMIECGGSIINEMILKRLNNERRLNLDWDRWEGDVTARWRTIYRKGTGLEHVRLRLGSQKEPQDSQFTFFPAKFGCEKSVALSRGDVERVYNELWQGKINPMLDRLTVGEKPSVILMGGGGAMNAWFQNQLANKYQYGVKAVDDAAAPPKQAILVPKDLQMATTMTSRGLARLSADDELLARYRLTIPRTRVGRKDGRRLAFNSNRAGGDGGSLFRNQSGGDPVYPDDK